MGRPTELPEFARDYQREVASYGATRFVVLLHRWLTRENVELATLSRAQIDVFLEAPAGKPIGRMTRNGYRWELCRYLTWLAERGLITAFDRSALKAYHRRPLTDQARAFLAELSATRRHGTVNGYRTTLGRFHDWLERRGTTIVDVDRDVCLSWAQHLHDQGLHPASRVGMLVSLRRYLDWLFERGIARAPGRELILSTDLPKKPQYLPRPLGADADRVLQERLKKEGDPIALGLYVMRRTGLRIGELRQLERECVRVDHHGQAALKVPLGKMNNERVVPLDKATLAAITELQRRARGDSDWLLEGARGRPMGRETFNRVLQRLGHEQALHITPHQLRHTFATALMNGGMSLPGIMKLLGHKDYRMTLRYTAIADETVGREYFEALSRVAERYDLIRDRQGAQLTAEDPVAAIEDVIRWVTKHLRSGSLERRAKLLIRRLESAREELVELKANAEQETSTG